MFEVALAIFAFFCAIMSVGIAVGVGKEARDNDARFKKLEGEALKMRGALEEMIANVEKIMRALRTVRRLGGK